MKNLIVPASENDPQNSRQDNVSQIGFTWAYSGEETSLPAPVPVDQPVPSGPKLTPLVYTIEEAAVVLNCSTKSIRRLIDRGRLSACSAFRKKLIPRSQIEAFLKATCKSPKTWN